MSAARLFEPSIPRNGVRVKRLSQEREPDSITLVVGAGAPIAAQKLHAMFGGGGSDECIVDGSARDTPFGKLEHEPPIRLGAETQEGLRKTLAQEVPDQFTGSSVRRRKARQDR